MLIVTTNAFAAAKTAGLFTNWQGPHVLVTLPDSGLPRERLRQLQDEFIVIECLQFPTNTAALFCDIEKWLRPLLVDDAGPLLWLDSPIHVPQGADPSSGAEDVLHAEMSDDGKLASLLLGEAISTSPLLPGFFDFIRGRDIDDGTLVDLLENAFSWKPS